MVQRLLYDGDLVALSAQIVLRKDFYEKGLQCLYGLFAQKPELLLAEFRDALGISRYALAFLEFWDSEGVTLESGDVRTLLKKV